MTQSQAILQRLLQTPNRWVAMPLLSREPCKYGLEQSFAVNSRVSDLRREGHTITNQTRKVDGKTKSHYKLILKQGQRSLFGNMPHKPKGAYSR